MLRKYGEQFEKNFNLTRTFSSICGLDVINKNYKPCWKTFSVFLLINFSIGLTFYTNYIEIVLNGNIHNLLTTAAILGTALQVKHLYEFSLITFEVNFKNLKGYCKMFNVVVNQKTFRLIYYEISEIYETYELRAEPYKDCLKNSVTLVKHLLSTLLLFIGITTTFIIGLPIYMSIFKNIRMELLPFKFPYIDMETNFGYYLTTTAHIIAVFFGAFGNFVIDSWLYTFAAHVPLIKNLLKCKFNDLDNILEMEPKDMKKVLISIKDIIKWHQKYIK